MTAIRMAELVSPVGQPVAESGHTALVVAGTPVIRGDSATLQMRTGLFCVVADLPTVPVSRLSLLTLIRRLLT
jgi:hypothetical protein